MTKSFFKDAISAIKKGKKFAIFIHINPDGDAVGSAKAIQNLLKTLGKESFIFCDDKVSFDTTFICDGFDEDQTKLEECDTYICLDISGVARAGKYQSYLQRKDKTVVIIDHHVPQDNFGNIVCRDSDSASTAELVYKLFIEMDAKISAETALYLYVGVSSDTGCFVYQNTTAFSHECAAKLIELGADTTKANYELFVRRPEDYIDLSKLAFKKLKVYGNKLSIVAIDNRTFKKYHEFSSFYMIDALRFYTTDVLIIAVQKEKML